MFGAIGRAAISANGVGPTTNTRQGHSGDDAPGPDLLVRPRPRGETWLVVSNNARNTHLRSALVVRARTSAKPPLPSIVPIELSGASRAGQELLGSVLCDDIEVLDDDHHVRPGSGLPPHIMQRVDAALTVALALT